MLFTFSILKVKQNESCDVAFLLGNSQAQVAQASNTCDSGHVTSHFLVPIF